MNEEIPNDDPARALLGGVTDEQLLLLEAIWQGVDPLHHRVGMWPIWSWVERHLELEHPDLDAEHILRSLPKLAPTDAFDRGWGHVWTANPGAGDIPAENDRIGLSIAGLREIGRTRPQALMIADEIVETVIGAIARRALKVPISTTEAGSEQVPLANLLDQLNRSTRQKPLALTETMIGELVQKEYRHPFELYTTDHDNPLTAQWTVRIGGNKLRAYRRTYTADDYMRVVQDLRRKESPMASGVISDIASPVSTEGDIFIVHGQDDAAKLELARALQDITGRKPKILHEQANGGRTIIEKFEHYAARAAVAVILLTADDVGGEADGEQHPRARQNVVLELGYFIGKLGRGHVIALKKGKPEIPSDIFGVVYIDMDKGNWLVELARDLNDMGIEADLNKLNS